jgi:hypothetical protein
MKAVFRKWTKTGPVFAMLCGTARDCNPGNVMCYEHVGQHSEGSRSLGQKYALATPEEYAPLQREIARIYGEPITPVRRLVA